MDDNEIIELNSDKEDSVNLEINTLNNNDNNHHKKSLKDKWNDLDKKYRIMIIVIPIVILVVALSLVLYLTVFKDNTPAKEKEKEEEVVIEKDNYRYENGRLVFLDKLERALGSYDCVNKDPNKCAVAKSNFTDDTFERVVSVYEDGTEIIANSPIYFDQFIFVTDGDKIILYDIQNKNNLLELSNIKIYDASSNLVVVKDLNNLYGLIKIDEKGYQTLIKCTYDNLGIINSSLKYLVAESKDNKYIIDSNGKKLTSNINEEIKSASKEYIVTYNKQKYQLYSLKGEEILTGYDYIGFNNNLITLVLDDKLYIRDNKLNKLNEEGYPLTNNNYVKKYIFDSNNKLKEEKIAYEININDNIINIYVDDDTYKINSYEGLVSHKYNYLSYYDGILYFYKDSNKDEVIGSYTCTNKNTINKEDSTLDKCFIYQEDDLVSGIYNEVYVFIRDGEEDNFYLYDLKNSKVMGTYSEINFLNSSELNKDIKLITTDVSYVLAKSKVGSNKDNYGILEINKEKAQGKIEFKYRSVMKNNDYYLFISKDNVYTIYNHDFKKISNEFAYIELFPLYYVGISDNKLNIYKYEEPLGILNEGLTVNSNDFTIDFTDGFTITVDGEVYKYNLEGNLNEE